jgi:hypothetical protein
MLLRGDQRIAVERRVVVQEGDRGVVFVDDVVGVFGIVPGDRAEKAGLRLDVADVGVEVEGSARPVCVADGLVLSG